MKRSILALAAAFVASIAIANAQEVANPVTVMDASSWPFKTQSVTCLSSNGTNGTWLPVTQSVVTTQPALVNAQANGGHDQSILYCIGTDGAPGIINNAPASLLLPTGSQVSYSPSVQFSYAGDRPKSGWGYVYLLTQAAAVYIDENGSTLLDGPHRMVVYLRGATVIFRTRGTASYIKPGPRTFRTGTELAGCTVTHIDTGGHASVSKYPADCAQLVKDKPGLYAAIP
jgi:hypothetical protein